MYSETEDVIRALAENAESVCRAYLPAGRREGSYWIVGDLQNNPGRSLFVRLTGPTSGPGARGKWQDAAVGLHGDLLDIIRERTGISRFPDLLAEARAHLGRPQPVLPNTPVPKKPKAPGGTPAAAARLFAASVPVAGTLADTYLRARGLTQGGEMSALRFHPKCWHRDEGQTQSIPRPALIAAVTDEAEAFEALVAETGMTTSGLLRHMIRLSSGIVAFRRDEVTALKASANQLNALARNLVQMLKLAHAGKLRWNARDAAMVGRLADRAEEVARAVQALRAASLRGSFVRVSDLRDVGEGQRDG